MAKQETDISNRIRLAVSDLGVKIFRNHVGFIRDADGRGHRFGLCPGSSDLIGWTPVTITPDMVGNTVAVFTAIEVKTPRGKPTAKQQNFIDAVLNDGGFAGDAHSDSGALSIIKKAP